MEGLYEQNAGQVAPPVELSAAEDRGGLSQRLWQGKAGRIAMAGASLLGMGVVEGVNMAPARADNNPGGGTVTTTSNEVCLTNSTGQKGCVVLEKNSPTGLNIVYSNYPAKTDGTSYSMQDDYQPNPPYGQFTYVTVSGTGGSDFSKFIPLPYGDYQVGLVVCEPADMGTCDYWGGEVFLNNYSTQSNCNTVLPSGSVVGMAATADNKGYWIASNDGQVAACGDAAYYPSGAPGTAAITAAPDGKGYWLVTGSGQVEAYGTAQNYGGIPSGTHLNKPIVAMAADPATGGYWLLGGDGGVFSFHAPFMGSTGNIKLVAPAVGLEATPDGGGYRFVASDGGIFDYGNAKFEGSLGGIKLNKPVVGMANDPVTGGYWLDASDGGIFAFNAPFYGSTGNITLAEPCVGMTATSNGSGYWFVASDGGIFAFRAPFEGSAA